MKKTIVMILIALSSGTLLAQTSPHGAITIPCESCHSTASWAMRPDAAFDHASTGFTLAGQHRVVSCASCHAGLRFAGTSSTCSSCHTDIHRSELGTDCLRCHSTQSWLVADMVQRHQQTRFPLVGPHTTAACQSCHSPSGGMQYAGTPVTCVGCHHNDYSSTTNPPHASSGFSSDCIQCHRPDAFVWGTGFDHNRTGFPLQGSHMAVPCAGCHTNNVFRGTQQECYACHAGAYTSVTDPNHAAAGFSHRCTDCHTTASWRPSSFSHDNTRFPLAGAHRAVVCAQCHVNNIFTGLSTDCVPCHQTDFASVTQPNHVTAAFPQTCLSCHSMNGWSPAAFDHASTGFPLTGRHMTTDCGQCHTNGNYQLTYQNCYQCHQTDYQQVSNPNHVTLAFSTDCQGCHSTTGWSGAAFDHATTSFPLTGHHTTLDCASCHVNNNYQLAYQGCYGCHQSSYAQTANPNHTALAFSQVCETCHSTTAWTPASFDHSTSGFALTGRHSTLDCASCHVNNNYQLTYQGCYGCHQSSYAQTTNPNHTALAFSQICETCHSTTAWTPASFDHSTSGFPLTGAHSSVSCASCHVDGNYQLTYQDCYQCHQADYQRPTNPNHVTLLLSHQCASCHSTTAWSPSTFDHDRQFFRIYSGKHAGRWQTCATCHTTLGQYQSFTCLSCHEHNQAETDGHHSGVSGYIYASPSCYSCHRNV